MPIMTREEAINRLWYGAQEVQARDTIVALHDRVAELEAEVAQWRAKDEAAADRFARLLTGQVVRP